MANQNLCSNVHKIQAFPTLRLFKDGVPQLPDYRGDRTLDALVQHVSTHIARAQQIDQLPEDERRRHLAQQDSRRDDHPACMLSGNLIVNRYIRMRWLVVQNILMAVGALGSPAIF
jgi:hypothetical protein